MKYAYCTLFLIILIPSFLSATTIIPFRHLGEAAQLSDAVVLAKAQTPFETALAEEVFYDCTLRVSDRIKGSLSPGELFTVRQQSHRTGDFRADFPGDFVPEEGKTYLIFLKQSGDIWRPVTMTYYIFEVKKIGTESFLVPLDESFSFVFVPRPDGATPESPGIYRMEEMLHILKEYVSGTTSAWNAAPALTSLMPGDFPQERVLPTGCDFDLGSGLCRWQNAAINTYYDDTNAPSGFGIILGSVQSAMTTSYPDISPANSGQVSFTPDCGDGVVTGADFTSFLASLNGNQTTLILFEDPCSQIPDLSGCIGTLAIGGGYSSSATHTYKGDTWKNALWGYVVVNNGTFGCQSSADYQIMLTHELTHTYRMDHLNSPPYLNQNMNPFCCNNINTKDIECMNYTYDLSLPVQLVTFDAQPLGDRQVHLTWSTAAETDNNHFILERSADGLRFEVITSVPGHNSFEPHHYDWTDRTPLPGLNYYRLSQVDFDGQASSLGIKVVAIGHRDEDVSIYPNPAKAEAMSLKTAFSFDFYGTLEISDMSGRIVAQRSLSLEKGKQITEQSVAGLAPGVYWLKLQSASDVRVLRFFKN